MNKFPKISIVTPNYNGEKYLEETILSVLNQNYPNLEYIIIDGGSTDKSVEIIRKYEDKLAFWLSEPDEGLYDAIQKGFNKSSGEIMAWINSDDMYHRNALHSVAEIFTSFKQVSWLQGIPTTFDEFGRTVECANMRSWSKFNFYLYNYKWIQQESVFWRRSLWIKSDNKIDKTLKYAGDLDLWLRFFRHEKLYCLNALIGGFRMRSSNQISLDSLDGYINEAKSRISIEKLSKEDKKIIFIYRMIKYASRMVSKTKILDISFLMHYFEKKYFGYPSQIYFDRFTQTFKIH